VTCTATDGGSGLRSSAEAQFMLSTTVAGGSETAAAVTESRSICDMVGNCTPAGPIGGFKVDMRAPSVTITAPTPRTYLLNERVASQYACSDAGSGVRTCAGSVPAGRPIDTSRVGAQTFTVQAADVAGNPGLAAVAYSIGFGTRSLNDEKKIYRRGGLVPLKVALVDAAGRHVSPAAVALTTRQLRRIALVSGALKVETVTGIADAEFRYDAKAGGYVRNLSTVGL